MGHRNKIIKEWIDVSITTALSTVKQSIEVDKHASKIIGIAISADNDDSLYFRGTQKITINEMEIYPEGYESKMLMQGINVAVNDRIIKLGEEIDPGNRKVELEFTDIDNTNVAFGAYKVRLYVYSRIDE